MKSTIIIIQEVIKPKKRNNSLIYIKNIIEFMWLHINIYKYD